MLQEEISEGKYIFITFNVSLSSVLFYYYETWYSIFKVAIIPGALVYPNC